MSVESSHAPIIFLDTIPFFGGSKVATQTFLEQFPANSNITILSANPEDWDKTNFKVQKLLEPSVLLNKTTGIPYLLRHAIIALNLVKLRIQVGPIQLMVGCSNSCNDFALFLASKLFKSKLCQFTHGPVYPSNLMSRSFVRNDLVYYLPSVQDSIEKLLEKQEETLEIQQSKVKPFLNGLSESQWPSPVKPDNPMKLFWAASTLKWKGLDLFLGALRRFSDSDRPDTSICYIKPHSIELPITDAPQPLQGVSWFEKPDNFDQIRQSSNVFISTSEQEPFGLSVLECLAAGMCVLIPKDGAYWDQELVHGVNCLKYEARSVDALYEQISILKQSPSLIHSIGIEALKTAENYRAETLYKNIVKEVLACD